MNIFCKLPAYVFKIILSYISYDSKYLVYKIYRIISKNRRYILPNIVNIDKNITYEDLAYITSCYKNTNITNILALLKKLPYLPNSYDYFMVPKSYYSYYITINFDMTISRSKYYYLGIISTNNLEYILSTSFLFNEIISFAKYVKPTIVVYMWLREIYFEYINIIDLSGLNVNDIPINDIVKYNVFKYYLKYYNFRDKIKLTEFTNIVRINIETVSSYGKYYKFIFKYKVFGLLEDHDIHSDRNLVKYFIKYNIIKINNSKLNRKVISAGKYIYTLELIYIYSSYIDQVNQFLKFFECTHQFIKSYGDIKKYEIFNYMMNNIYIPDEESIYLRYYIKRKNIDGIFLYSRYFTQDICTYYFKEIIMMQNLKLINHLLDKKLINKSNFSWNIDCNMYVLHYIYNHLYQL